MNNFMKLFAIFAVYIQIQSALSQPNPSPKPSLIQQLCKRNRYQALCISTLNQDPRSKTSDLQGLATIAIDATTKKMNETSYYFSDYLGNITDRGEWEMYATCIENYNVALRFIKEVLADLKAKKYPHAVATMNNEVLQAPNTCDDQFDKPPLPVSSRDKASREIVEMTSDIIKTFIPKIF